MNNEGLTPFSYSSPLRKRDDVDNAIELFIKNIDKADSLVSLGKVHLESQWEVSLIFKDKIIKEASYESENNSYA